MLKKSVLVLFLVTGAMPAFVFFGGKTKSNKTVDQAAADIAAFVSSLEQYMNIGGYYPSEAQGLKALLVKPQTPPRPRRWTQTLRDKSDLLDPWGTEYRYNYDKKKDKKPVVTSAGPDKKFGTDDDIRSQPEPQSRNKKED